MSPQSGRPVVALKFRSYFGVQIRCLAIILPAILDSP